MLQFPSILFLDSFPIDPSFGMLRNTLHLLICAVIGSISLRIEFLLHFNLLPTAGCCCTNPSFVFFFLLCACFQIRFMDQLLLSWYLSWEALSRNENKLAFGEVSVVFFVELRAVWRNCTCRIILIIIIIFIFVVFLNTINTANIIVR